MKMQRTIVALAAASVLFAGALAFGAGFPGISDEAEVRQPSGAVNIAAESRPAGRAAPTMSGNPLWGVPLKELSATREHPLFSATRRPPAPPAPAAVYTVASVAKPAEPERPQLKLVGTIAGDGAGFGIFLDQSGNKAVKLKTGQSHNGWMLRQVRGREAVLEKNDETVVLVLPAVGASANAGTQVAGESGARRTRR